MLLIIHLITVSSLLLTDMKGISYTSFLLWLKQWLLSSYWPLCSYDISITCMTEITYVCHFCSGTNSSVFHPADHYKHMISRDYLHVYIMSFLLRHKQWLLSSYWPLCSYDISITCMTEITYVCHFCSGTNSGVFHPADHYKHMISRDFLHVYIMSFLLWHKQWLLSSYLHLYDRDCQCMSFLFWRKQWFLTSYLPLYAYNKHHIYARNYVYKQEYWFVYICLEC